MKTNKISSSVILNNNISIRNKIKLNTIMPKLESIADTYGYNLHFAEHNDALLMNIGPRTSVINPEAPDFVESIYKHASKVLHRYSDKF